VARLVRTLALGGAAVLFYGTVIERHAFVLRRFDVPVLDPGSEPIKLLHISDLHLLPRQQRKIAYIQTLAELKPDIVINTGDTLASADGIPAIMAALNPLMTLPGAFVPGNNDYFAPTPKNPMRYFNPGTPAPKGPPLPWDALAARFSLEGWIDLTHRRETVTVGGQRIALAGTDDPHLRRARYELIAGPADSDAVVRIGVIHSPEPALLSSFADDGYDLVLAGHTHGGQVRVPFGPAIVTNCGIDVRRARWLHAWDEHMYFHVCAGLGSSPWMPIRFACRPEASLLTLVPRRS
jgi:predicted MPP superfamily phosphohydrolase